MIFVTMPSPNSILLCSFKEFLRSCTISSASCRVNASPKCSVSLLVSSTLPSWFCWFCSNAKRSFPMPIPPHFATCLLSLETDYSTVQKTIPVLYYGKFCGIIIMERGNGITVPSFLCLPPKAAVIILSGNSPQGLPPLTPQAPPP